MRAIFQVQSLGAYIWRGDLTESFLRYRFGRLIFGGAYFRNFMVFRCCQPFSLEKVSSYGLLPRFIYIRELKIETFSGRRQLQPDVTSSFVGYCACSCSPPCRRGPVGDVKLVCLALWRKREYLTFISIRFVAFSNQNFADYRS